MNPARLKVKTLPARRTVFWSLALVLAIVITPFILRLGVTLFNVNVTTNATVALLSLGLLGTVLMLTSFVIIARLFRQPVKFKDIAISRPLVWSDASYAVIGFIVYALISSILLYVYGSIGGNVTQPQEFGLGQLFGTERLYAMLIFVVAVPIAEEVLFRGMLYSKIRQSGLHWITAAAVVSGLFGAAHGQWNVAIDVFVMSMVMCYLREKTGTILAGILVHVLKNFIGFYLTFILLQGMGT